MASRVTKTLPPVGGKRYRITRLDECGNIVYGDNASVVTESSITTTYKIVTNDKAEVKVVNDQGNICLLVPAESRIAAVEVTTQFCGMNPDMFSIMTGLTIDYDVNGVAVGVRADTTADIAYFALEQWTGLVDAEACGQVGVKDYGYILLPFLGGGRISDVTVAVGAVNFTLTGATSRNGGSWGVGPYDVMVGAGSLAGRLLVPMKPTQPWLVTRTNVAPPAATDGGRPVLDPTAVALTTLTAATTAGSYLVTFTVAASPASGVGVYIDFGDGTYDYLIAPLSTITHTYDSTDGPATYTAFASTNDHDVSATVVVPGPGS